MTDTRLRRPLFNRLFRKSIVLPAEHGTWFWYLVPLLVGIGVVRTVNTAVLLVALGTLALFLVRQPFTRWLQIRQGRGRRADGPVALVWTVAFTASAALCFLLLLLQGHEMLFRLTLPLAILAMLYVAVALRGRARLRTLWLELVGAAGLALVTPAVVIVATGRLDALVWALWGLLAAQSGLGAMYVHLRLAATKRRTINASMIILSHGLVLVAVGLGGRQGVVPPATAILFALLLGRAIWAGSRPRPVANIKQFGLWEALIELLGGGWIVGCYWLWLL